MEYDRRQVLTGLGAAALASAAGGSRLLARTAAPDLPPRPPSGAGRVHEWIFAAAERPTRLLGPDGPVSTVWSYSDDLLPIKRVRVGDTIRARLENRLGEHTALHWHGVRVPNAMDGVPYLTQPPVNKGESFLYEVSPPDPGTFFIHPHCNESGQTGRGLSAVLIVEGDERRRPDADLVMAYKDWRLAEDGRWLPFETPEGASRAGTYGTVRAVNGVAPATHPVPAHGDVRLRVLNLDATRVIEVGVEGAEAAVIAIDGNAVSPFPLDTWRMGPAMRIDLLVRAPAAGRSFRLIDYFSAEPWTLATCEARPGKAAPKRPFDPAILYAPALPRADIGKAERLSYTFSAASGSVAEAAASLAPDDPLAGILLDGLCVRDNAFWAINKAGWASDRSRRLPPPLGLLKAGRSYVFELTNATPHHHPIHLHGHTFEVLGASRLKRPRHFADTVLLQPKERIEIAFVAAEGNWMFHCHVLEHMEYGMMGYLRIA
ncbi:multicopper oxidase family protein [Microvirga thermotolerans]|uniref:Multicopper oxidase domain-containing protein n=1 Tax=Microvirga thermotolerans TaxID=2651334 RepID=A0A5P9JZQ5_9HYPH|nr:multicopper oxidase family protein [Microvirga thermotolerans]QFU16755.1 multicopper oxidase domain-containing protein [Microvirga thermotolerans]